MARAKKSTPSVEIAPGPKYNTRPELEQSALPTEQLIVGIMGMEPSPQRDDAVQFNIDQFGRALVLQSKRPWFEVLYPAPDHLTPEEAEAWLGRQPDTFDAVELVEFEIAELENGTPIVVGGRIVTLPPYSEIGGAA